ncbi:E3 ubiquitin-protein ligase RNF14-like isoform X2 [Lineus longissimus]
MSDDKEDQEDELLALASIYNDETFTATQEGGDPGGYFSAQLNLPHPFHVKLVDQREASAELSSQPKVDKEPTKKNPVKDLHEVEYLPPIILNFQLPANYPSESPPKYTVSCKWLTRQQLTRLCHQLDKIWEENVEMVILFSWFTFLKEETFEFLNIQNPLDLGKIIPRRNSKQESVLDGANKAAENVTETVITSAHNNDLDLHDLGHDFDLDPRAIQDIASQALLLPTIKDYDNQQKIQAFDRTLFTCNVCFLEKLGELCIKFHECEHVFCKECMSGYFEVQINEGSVKALTCPFDKCDTQALPSQVKLLVKPEIFAKYDRLLLQSSLDTMADIIYCPRVVCQCPVMQDAEEYMGQCPACNFVFCTLCKMAYHGVSPCRVNSGDLYKLREAYLEAGTTEKKFLEKRYGMRAIKQAMEETYSKEWLDEYSKKCPNCSTHIQKIDGCNKMTCIKCRTYFCWLCKGVLSRTNPYTHFNVPDGACFNRLFEGTDPGDEFEEWQEGNWWQE